MLDIHTHLYFPDFDADRDEVVRRAREAGVGFMISVGTDPGDNMKAIGIAEAYDGVLASVGLHPHFFNRPGIDSDRIVREIESLKELAKHPKVAAIGECGLDYFIRKEQGTGNKEQDTIGDERKEIQRTGFLAQMEIAKEQGLPLIIHTRPSVGTMDAYEDVFEILKNHLSCITHPASGFILHCYQGDTEVTEKFLTLPNVFFSFAGSITYPVKKSVVGTKDDPSEVVKMIPLKRLFVETDCPFLAPQGKRGERNEPAFVLSAAETIAAVHTVSVEEIGRQVEKNALLVFRGK